MRTPCVEPAESGRMSVPDTIPDSCTCSFTPNIECQLEFGHPGRHYHHSDRASLKWEDG